MRAAEKRLRTSWLRRIVSYRTAAANSGGRTDDGPDRRKGDAMTFEHRYDRNNQALSNRERQALSECKVAVIGCGGLGGSVEEMTLR